MSALKAEAGTNGASAENCLVYCRQALAGTNREILKLLGWKLKHSDKKISLEVSGKEVRRDQATLPGGMGVDEIQMKSALEAGSAFTLRVKDEQVPIIFDEKFWLERVIEKVAPPGGLLEAFLETSGDTLLFRLGPNE
jgi:hypothetical protein